jgi:sensor histidine kinase YesM
MRIRTKFLALILIVAGLFLGLSILSVSIYRRIGGMRRATDKGLELIADSIRAHALMKDVVFDIFSPRLYSSLRGIVMSARGFTTQREWLVAIDEFRLSYESFMSDPELKRLVAGDEELREAYALAGRMSARAFEEAKALKIDFDMVKNMYSYEENLYARLLQSKDESLYDVFDKVRSTSFYLTNVFESYLSRFVSGLEAQAKAAERRMLLGYVLASALFTAAAAWAVLRMTRSFLANIRLVDLAVERISEGDFSSRVSPQGHDELGLLAGRINLFAQRLKGNVDSLVDLLGELNAAVSDEPDFDRILSLISDAAIRDVRAESAEIYVAAAGMRASSASGLASARDGAGGGRAAAECASSGRPLVVRDARAERVDLEGLGLDPSLRSAVVAPLSAGRGGTIGACVFGMRSRPFTDLELSHLLSFADYAAQLVENLAVNAALRARGDAEYRALQSQIEPHFMYNVLNGFVALNRMGDRAGLEMSIHAFRDMLRYTVEHGTWATVAEEFEFLERYCRLQKLRFEERLSYSFDLEEAVAGLPIPKLLVQPLLENAILHGVEPSPAPASVAVSARPEEGALVIEVADDGRGCDSSSIRERQGIGLGNVRERLALLYARSSLELEGRPGSGFRSRIRIPLEELGPAVPAGSAGRPAPGKGKD